MFIEIVQSTLPNPYEMGVAGPGQLQNRPNIVARLVGMQSHRGVDLHRSSEAGDSQGLGRRSGVSADDHHSINPTGEGPFQGGQRAHRRLVVGKEAILQVTVRVGPATHSSLLMRGNSGSPLSTGRLSGDVAQTALSAKVGSAGLPRSPIRRQISSQILGMAGDAKIATRRMASRASPMTASTAGPDSIFQGASCSK